MRTTIDKAGQVVIPAAIRKAAGLTPSTELGVQLEELLGRPVPSVLGPKIVRVGNPLPARPSGSPEKRPGVDVGRLVEEEHGRGAVVDGVFVDISVLLSGPASEIRRRQPRESSPGALRLLLQRPIT